MLAILLIVIFIALLVSAYNQYQLTLSTAGLVDTASSITNNLVIDKLAREEGGRLKEYVVDLDKIFTLDNRIEVGGENFEFQLKLYYKTFAERMLGPFGSTPLDGRAVSVLTLPVALYENGRIVYANLEVKVWRA